MRNIVDSKVALEDLKKSILELKENAPVVGMDLVSYEKWKKDWSSRSKEIVDRVMKLSEEDREWIDSEYKKWADDIQLTK
jgi:hypothetical protein